MSKSKPRVSIVGLGLIGSSIGLALRKADVTAAVIREPQGHGRRSQANRCGGQGELESGLRL